MLMLSVTESIGCVLTIKSLEDLDSFLLSIDCAQSLDEILSLLQKTIQALGFERFTYWLRWSGTDKEPIALTTYPDKFIEHYLSGSFQNYDMVGRVSMNTNRPFVWSEIPKFFEVTRMQKMLFDDSSSAGMHSGASVPIHGPQHAQATFSVVSSLSQKECDEIFQKNRHFLHILATYAHEKILSFGIDQRLIDISLTQREADVLTWVARGKTYWEIGQILCIQEDTVKKYMQKIFSILSVTNSSHAVAKAIINGLIHP